MFGLCKLEDSNPPVAPIAEEIYPPRVFLGARVGSQRLRQAAVTSFFVVLLFVMWGITLVEDLHGWRFTYRPPNVVSGDEIHYLLAINTLLFHHQFELQDAYARARRDGSREAAGHYLPDDHTWLVNRRTGAHCTYFAGCGFSHPSPDVYEVSIHAMGYPLFIAGLLVPLRPPLEHVSVDISRITVLVSWLTVVITYLIAVRIGMPWGFALFTAATVGLASPCLAYTRSYFSEPEIGLSLALSLWAFESDRPKLAALGAGVASWFKAPLGLAAIGFVIDRLWSGRWRDAAEMFLVLGLYAAVLLGFNYWLARMWLIGNLGAPVKFDFSALRQTLIGSYHGLFVFAPWTIVAFASLLLGWRHSVVRRIAVPVLVYLIVISSVGVAASASYGPRHWVPFLPWLAIAAVESVRSSRLMPVFVVLVALSVTIAIPGALHYHHLFDVPVTYPFGILATK